MKVTLLKIKLKWSWSGNAHSLYWQTGNASSMDTYLKHLLQETTLQFAKVHYYYYLTNGVSYLNILMSLQDLLVLLCQS